MTWSLRLSLFLQLLFPFSVFPQTNVPHIEWQRIYGGVRSDRPWVLKQVGSEGYIVAGYSLSPASGTKSGPHYGEEDIWVVRLDSDGRELWQQTLGGTDREFCWDLVQVSDGGFILVGESQSEISGNKTSHRYGDNGPDGWIVRLDKDGNKIWDRSFGGSGADICWSVAQTVDDGFIIITSSNSTNGNKTVSGFGSLDYWVFKTNQNFEILWQRAFGGDMADGGFLVRRVPQGGYIIGGDSQSQPSGNKTSPHFGPNNGQDYWIIRIDEEGRKLWEKSYGGTGRDRLVDLRPTKDGGFILGGRSSSPADGNKSSPRFGSYDIWIVKINSQGGIQWDQSYGGDRIEFVNDIIPTMEGGFIIGGASSSGVSGNKSSPNFANHNSWVVRIDEAGEMYWDFILGGDLFEDDTALIQTRDGGFLVASGSWSPVSGNKTIPGHGFEDYWLVKLRPDTIFLKATSLSTEQSSRDPFAFWLSAPTNTYILEYTTNFGQWTPFQTNNLTENSTEITDHGARNAPQRFYRVRTAHP